MSKLQDYLHQLNTIETSEEAKNSAENPLSNAYELGHAKCALYGAGSYTCPSLLKSGAAKLFAGFYYAWGGLPYPKEHALFALQLKALGYEREAKHMAYFQQVMLDPNGNLISSLFSQESVRGYHEASSLSRELIEIMKPNPLPDFFVDDELALIRFTFKEGCALFCATGCLSGQGAFLSASGGVLNMGPQTTPIGECSGFGIAGCAKQFEVKEKSVHAISTLGKAYERNFVLPQIQDAMIGTQWVKCEAQFEEGKMKFNLEQKALYRLEPISYALFLKGERCRISGLHKLKPKSLDRYLGPPGEIETGGVRITLGEGVEKLEVRPLAGDESFWGADFIAFLTVLPHFSCQFQLA